MTVSIVDGWMTGSLPGPAGDVPVKRFAQGPYIRLATGTPNLVLHTTETAGYVEHLEYPSQFQVGEGFIGQHRPLWAKGEALRGDTTNDPYAMQIEIVGYSKLDVWLPGPLSLQPLVALVAFLHDRGLIKVGVKRPADWPTRLDRGPQAVESYYRRNAGLWPNTPGVYGHVDIPGNTHWDPGSFDYPRFFDMVVTGAPVSDEMSDYSKGQEAFCAAARNGNPDNPPNTEWTAEKKQGYRDARLLYFNPVPAEPGTTGTHNHGYTITLNNTPVPGTTDAA